MEQKHYIMRGGEQGRARLLVLSRVMRPTTLGLLNQAGIRAGMKCLEIGCGSGDVAFDLAWIVGLDGSVEATDLFMNCMSSPVIRRQSSAGRVWYRPGGYCPE
jgi:hypothetical protein